ncbi:Alpha-(1,3)-fucosyltransferase 11 [Actinomortierella ambigua]|nr:Alpha-(1,3)-fucosyltransferase 11 [Actinomortierella ambigua]
MFELDTKDTPPLDADTRKKAWILQTAEAPMAFQRDPRWTKMFTHLWSYQFTADFVQTYFIAGRGPHSYLLSSIMKEPAFTIDGKNQKRREGLAPVAWIASNCRAHNNRHYYVKQLLKYIDVDIYGKCLKNKEWPKNEHGKDLSASEVVAPYKFYLAIENSNCDDYVTEKLERPLRLGVVPIVDGPKDYSPFIPTSDSVIREDAFASPEHLAKYLHKLDNDDTAYMRHLSFKYPNGTDGKTLNHLSPGLRQAFDTGDEAGNWGKDLRGVRCNVCKLTHDLAEGIVTLDPKRQIPIDQTCEFGKWDKAAWAYDFWFWHIMFALSIVGLLLFLLTHRRARGVLMQCANSVVSKVNRLRRKEDDEAKVPFIHMI